MRKEIKTEDTLITFHISGGGGNKASKVYVCQDKAIEDYTSHLYVGYAHEAKVIRVVGLKFLASGRDFNESDFLDCLTNCDIFKLEHDYGVSESDLGEFGYKDQNGNWLHLPVGSVTGMLDEDGAYDTTIVKYLKYCTHSELQKILDSTSFVSEDVRAYCIERIND